MRLFYDDDLFCVFNELKADVTSLYSISLVCKSWNKVSKHLLLEFKQNYLKELIPTLTRYIYSCHNWKFEDLNEIYSEYDWNSKNGCIAFCHGDIITSGSCIEVSTFSTLCFNTSKVDITHMPFLDSIKQLDFFSSLKEDEITFSGNRDINLVCKYSNEFVNIVFTGYSPIFTTIDEVGDYENIKCHVNWRQVRISLKHVS
jgi:hypothetical protein